MMAQIPLKELLERERKTLWEVATTTKIRYNRLKQYFYNEAVMLKLSDVEILCKELNCEPADLLVLTNGNGKSKKKRL